MSHFPRTIQILSEMEGLVGAVIFNFSTHEVLLHVDKGLDLRSVVAINSDNIKRHQQFVMDMGLYDFAESLIATTGQHYHIMALMPQFDSVAVYLIVSRYIMLPYVMEKLEDVIYSMR